MAGFSLREPLDPQPVRRKRAGGAAVAVWPHGLCYANELWGGSRNSYRLVSDSNYDWGQGLPELAQWGRQHHVAALDVWYFGSDPRLAALTRRERQVLELAVAGKVVAEGAGALAYAALEQLEPGPVTVAVVSGVNIDPKLLASLLS